MQLVLWGSAVTIPVKLFAGTPQEQTVEVTLPRWKGSIIGRPGSGKSHAARSFPKGALVIATDTPEKLQPYYDLAGEITRSRGQFGQPVEVLYSAVSKKPIIQIEQFYDKNPNDPQAVTALIARAELLEAEVNAGMWQTVILDHWTGLETFAVYRRTIGPMAIKDANEFGRGHNAAKDDIKPILISRLLPLPCNVVILCHTTETQRDEGGVQFFGIKAIGKQLPTEMAAALPERYRSVSEADGITRRLYTRPDGRYDLCTLLHATSPCENSYQGIMSGWIAKKVATMEAQLKAESEAK